MNAARSLPEVLGRIREDEPMARHTTWRVGGTAELFFEPADIEDLATMLAQLPIEVPVYWVGLGSNLLVRDGGLKGLVISAHRTLGAIERLDSTTVKAEAGASCAKLARQCARWQLGKGAFFAGIPGTVGGALAMNAGAFGGETWNHVIDVEVIDRAGVRRSRTPECYDIGYRTVNGPPQEWFLAARLRFEPDPETGITAIRELLARRRETQPIGQPSCGSVFRNPPGDHAARLIEAAGLKGCRVGGAAVSPKHANFIISEQGASAADVEALIDHVRETVQLTSGIELVPEVRIVGERG